MFLWVAYGWLCCSYWGDLSDLNSYLNYPAFGLKLVIFMAFIALIFTVTLYS